MLGWKEYELEVMRDLADNVIIICSIENFDPMGVHTGDSITVAPAQTLTDREYQMMRDGALRCLREIGVETGGSNVQFAINPENGRMVDHRDESARVAQLGAGFEGHRIPDREDRRQAAVGYRLDEIRNDITRKTPACFEPTIDYVVVKIPQVAVRKISRRRTGARHADEVGRRSDGHRPHVQASAVQGHAQSLETGKASAPKCSTTSLIRSG